MPRGRPKKSKAIQEAEIPATETPKDLSLNMPKDSEEKDDLVV